MSWDILDGVTGGGADRTGTYKPELRRRYGERQMWRTRLASAVTWLGYRVADLADHIDPYDEDGVATFTVEVDP